MKKKIIDFILSLIIALCILTIIGFIIGAIIQVTLSIISENFLLMGLPTVFIIVFGFFILFDIVKELKKHV